MKKDAGKPQNIRLSDMDARLSQLEQEIERIKSLYEQYFAGVLRRVPEKEHSLLKSNFKAVGSGELRTTAGKFRFQGMKTRLLQLEQHWLKILKEIEEGTYKRDLFLLKAKERSQEFQEKNSGSVSAPIKVSGPKPPDPQLEVLYKKFSDLASGQNQKIPQKESFVKSIQTQIEAQKVKNPGAKFEIKLQKDGAGKYQVKLRVSKA